MNSTESASPVSCSQQALHDAPVQNGGGLLLSANIPDEVRDIVESLVKQSIEQGKVKFLEQSQPLTAGDDGDKPLENGACLHFDLLESCLNGAEESDDSQCVSSV